MIRLNQFLAQAGISSRRGADELIKEKKVKVNDDFAQLGQKIDPSKDTVSTLHGSTWKTVSETEEPVILALNKPRGYVTSLKKQGKQQIIKRFLPQSPRVFPVGRLDKDSEGLLLCTNDGEFAHELTHPSHQLEKTYIVHCTIPRNFTESKVKSYLGRVAKGVTIDGRKTQRADISLKRYLRPGMIELEITLKEGRNRQIRRMLGTINFEVVRLIRIRIGKLSLADLNIEPGKYVHVKKNNIV